MERFMEVVRDHFVADEKRFESIDASLKTMRDNHLFHMEKDMASAKERLTDVAELLCKLHENMKLNTKETVANTTNIEWLKWIIMTGGGAVIVGIIGTFIAVIFKR